MWSSIGKSRNKYLWFGFYVQPAGKWKLYNPIYHFYEAISTNSQGEVGNAGDMHYKCYHRNCKVIMVTRAINVMTVRLRHYFSFIYLSPFPIYCTMDTLPSLLVMPCGLCSSPLLSITHLTLTLTIPPTRASVPTDVHLSCPSNARLASLLPYVSLHHLCTLPDPPTCVIPHPLYAF